MKLLNNRSAIQIRNIQLVYFLVEFLLHNISNLIETVAAILLASVSKITSVRGADVR